MVLTPVDVYSSWSANRSWLHNFWPTFSKVSELADHWSMAPCVGNFIAISFLALMMIADEDVRYFQISLRDSSFMQVQ